MVCRRNVHHVGARFLKLVHQQARFVDGDRPPGVTERLGDSGELAIARVFHGERGGGPEHLQQSAVQVFAARADDDAVGRNVHAARAPQIRRDGAAQLGQAVERDRPQQVVARKRKRLAHIAPPHCSREQRYAGTVSFQVDEVFRVAGPLDSVRGFGGGGVASGVGGAPGGFAVSAVGSCRSVIESRILGAVRSKNACCCILRTTFGADARSIFATRIFDLGCNRFTPEL